MPDAEWWRAYRELSGEVQEGPKRGTFSALILAYKESPDWGQLSLKSRSERTRNLNVIQGAWGDLAVSGLEARHVLELRDRHAATPAAANNIVRSLSSMLSWSIPRGWRAHNPCTRVKKLKIGEGYSPWNWEEIDLFHNCARTDLWWAAALALYSGQRLGDVISMLWSDFQGGLIGVTQNKTGKKLAVPRECSRSTPLGRTTTASRPAAKPIASSARARPIEAELIGPENPFRKDNAVLKLPFAITIRDADSADLRIGGATHRLQRGVYSEWIRVAFAPRRASRCMGCASSCCWSTEPEFALYVTPINIDPERPAMPISYPAIYSTYLAKRQGPFATLGLAEDTWA